MKRIIYTRPDGGVSITVPALNARLVAETEDEFVTRIRTKDVPVDASDVQIVEEAAVPSDRTFRNAWRQTTGTISVVMSLAREIHAERIAIAQATELAHLKVEERKERLSSNTSQADTHAATITALEALDLNVLATRIAAALNATALSAIWPALVPR